MAQWNLARFAETLLPLLHPIQEKAIACAEEAIHAFTEVFQNHWLAGMRKKLGLFTEESEDVQLIATLLTWMQNYQMDYTNCFHALTTESFLNDAVFNDATFVDWHARWQNRLLRQTRSRQASYGLMQTSNPVILPRNHRVEEALTAASERGDYSLIHQLLAAVKNPYIEDSQYYQYSIPPLPSERVHQTFCGT
jgi:uncharacterized protein YdiU (UPF0061 family)